MNKNLNITIPALPRPTLEQLQEKHSWIKSIERDTSETKEVELSLISVLKKGETYIDGKEYEKRLPKKGLLGFQHLEWLVAHQNEYPELLAQDNDYWYIDFSGLVVVVEHGDRYVPYGAQSGKRWGAGWRWLGYGFHQNGRVTVSEQVAIRELEHSDPRHLDSLGLAKRVGELEEKMKKLEKIIKI